MSTEVSAKKHSSVKPHSFSPTSAEPSLPWPIPENGAEIEVARYRREPTENTNAKERMFFVRVRVVPGDLLRYIELRSCRRERDIITNRGTYDFFLVGGEAELEIVSNGKRRGWVGGAEFVDAKEMKGRKAPATLEKVFDRIVERVREIAVREEERYRRARAASEEGSGHEHHADYAHARRP